MTRRPRRSSGSNNDGQEPEIYPYIEDLPGLIGLVQMGVLEIHPWGSTGG